jgi:CheY-like chemotaxis protein
MKQILFVDDDTGFLSMIPQLFEHMSKGQWKILTASTHARALEILQNDRMDLVVLDIGMPVMDGMQFLRLLGRTHPGQQVVMLTGQATEERRKACLAQGATLLLEKPVTPEGYQAVFAALDSLSNAHSQAGFRGMMRQVGLQEVLQMECLGRKSSVLEVFTSKARGLIYISDGAIVHAESGALQGEAALYGLLGFRGGEFNFQSYTEPARRTINGQWEYLLMEAARLHDEGGHAEKGGVAVPDTERAATAGVHPHTDAARKQTPAPFATNAIESRQVRIMELLLCSGAGELLFEFQCPSVDARLQFLTQIEQHAGQLSTIIPAGGFDRLEITLPDGRMVAQIVPDRRLVVRSAVEKSAA